MGLGRRSTKPSSGSHRTGGIGMVCHPCRKRDIEMEFGTSFVIDGLTGGDQFIAERASGWHCLGNRVLGPKEFRSYLKNSHRLV